MKPRGKRNLKKRSKVHVEYTIIERKKTAHVRVRGRFKTTRRKLSAVKAREATAGERSLTNLEALVDNLPDATFVKDRNHRYVLVNKPFCAFLGKRKDQVLGKTAQDLYPKDVADISEESDEKVFELGVTVDSRERERPDGHGVAKILQTRKAPLKDAEGNVTHLVGISRDITERKQMEDEIRESETKYRSLFENSRDAISITTPDGKLVDANQAWFDLFGYSKDEITKIDIGNVYANPAARETFRQMVERNGFVKDFEEKRQKKNGTEIDCLTTSSVWRAEDGKTLAYQNVQHDITESKRMEESLRESEERYRDLFANSRDAITINTPDGKYIDVNQAHLDLLGYSKSELRGMNASDVYANPADRDRFRQEIERNGFVESYEVELRRKDGSVRDCLLTATAWRNQQGQTIGYQGIVRDITERKQMEDELRRSEERFRKIFQSSPIPALIISIEGSLLDVNDAWVRMSGYGREEAIGHSTIELGMVPDPGQRDQMVKDLLEKGRLINIEITRRTKSGELRDLLNTVELVELDGQKRILNMQVDVTDRKRMEEELRRHSENLEKLVEERTHDLSESEEKFRGIAERSFDMIAMLDLEGCVTYASPAVTWVTGNTPEEMMGQHFQKYLPKDVIPKEIEAFVEIAKGRAARAVQLRIVRKNGSLAQAEVNASPIIIDGKIAGVQAIVRDVTERYAIERMRDRFISAVTHELRTPLVSIKGYVDLVLDGSQSIPEEVESRLQVAKRNTDRLLSLVNDLLDIQRMQAERLQLEIQPTDFNKVVDSCMTEIQPLLEEKKLSLRLEVPEGELVIEGDQARLCQALMNLLSNATKFSPEGSEVTLHVEEENESIKVQVSDRGIGIRKEDFERVFEPFAAIEKPDYVKGTGLGLSITKGLVEAHGGRIWAESEGEGKGATFSFTIPKRKKMV